MERPGEDLQVAYIRFIPFGSHIVAMMALTVDPRGLSAMFIDEFNDPRMVSSANS